MVLLQITPEFLDRQVSQQSRLSRAQIRALNHFQGYNYKAKLATGAMPINGRVVVGTTAAGFATILLVS